MQENKEFYVVIKGEKVVVTEEVFARTCDRLEKNNAVSVGHGNVK